MINDIELMRILPDKVTIAYSNAPNNGTKNIQP
jgi:hypothetical protein